MLYIRRYLVSVLYYSIDNETGQRMSVQRQKFQNRVGILRALNCLLIMLLVLMAIPFQHGFAQSATSISTGTGNNLSISPRRREVVLRPGESRAVPVYVENLETKTVILKAIENDFIAGDDESGAPSIILNETEYAPTHSLKRFMEPLGSITVQPGERKEVKVTINVPENASAGGYYGALRFAPANPDGSEIVNVSASVASLIILTVPGNLTESLQLTNFDILQNGEKASKLSNSKNVSVRLRFENKGNVHLAPFGTVSVLKGSSRDPLYTVQFNDKQPVDLVLPDSARKFDIPLEKFGKFGKYTVKVVISYGSSNETIEVQKSIWIIPTSYVFGGILGIVVIAGVVTGSIFALRAYKRRILRQARRR